ncbi:hypothetical protein [Halobacillus amylolyticus]|uniref:Uncharacterized protein n=1 Tax=Halobacillus amylolyticus TaxID=2932259 RepID=A0ABY4HB27_9BACI|nr:hypothetical protein [Halobacillus amylolyticus]UOR12100.1 hypothetical protein MUO15_00710 [Halobacillus amylolyticus]
MSDEIKDQRITVNQKGVGQSSTINMINQRSMERIHELLEKGKVVEAADEMNQGLQLAQNKHPYAPWYKFGSKMVGDRMIFTHVPVSPDSLERYPMETKGKFSVVKKEEYKGKSLMRLLEEDYFKGQGIEVEMLSLDVFIDGNHVGSELKQLPPTGKWIISASEEPPIIPVKLYFKDEYVSILDYVLLRTYDYDQDKNILYFSNEQQQVPYLLKIFIDSNSSKINFNYSIREEYSKNVMANLNYCLFIQKTSRPTKIAMRDLEQDSDIFVANNTYKAEETISGIDYEIRFLEKLREIEENFGVEFTLPNREVTKDEEDALDYLYLISSGEKIEETFNNLTFRTSSKNSVQNIIYHHKETKEGLKSTFQIGIQTIDLFGCHFDVTGHTFYQDFDNVKLTKVRKLENLVEHMDEDDEVEVGIHFVPASNNKMVFYSIKKPFHKPLLEKSY